MRASRRSWGHRSTRATAPSSGPGSTSPRGPTASRPRSSRGCAPESSGSGRPGNVGQAGREVLNLPSLTDGDSPRDFGSGLPQAVRTPDSLLVPELPDADPSSVPHHVEQLLAVLWVRPPLLRQVRHQPLLAADDRIRIRLEARPERDMLIDALAEGGVSNDLEAVGEPILADLVDLDPHPVQLCLKLVSLLRPIERL